jgi:hypothetical protein
MTYLASFANGRHLTAARAMAGLKQTELAAMAGLHVNSVKRFAPMRLISMDRLRMTTQGRIHLDA